MAWRAVQILVSAARTATVASEIFDMPNIERLIVFIDATASAGTPLLVATIRGYKPVPNAGDQDTFDVLASATITGAGNTVLEVGPGVTAAANVKVSQAMPPKWNINFVHSSADSITYNASAWVYERD